MEDRIAQNEPKSSTGLVVGIVITLACLGVGTGYLISQKIGSGSNTVSQTTGKNMIQNKNEVGSTDTRTFRDSAVGTIESGGLNGEGTHKLVRDGGPSQTVYLISSVVDLSQFVGKKVEVWGETVKAIKVPWLMDVGRVKLVE